MHRLTKTINALLGFLFATTALVANRVAVNFQSSRLRLHLTHRGINVLKGLS
jgi:hypothetical protein